MGVLTMGPGEVTHVDVTAPYRALTFPVLELILVTGVCWIGIGWLDAHMVAQDYLLRNTLVAAWLVLVLWRFVLPVIRQRRKRFIVTNRRIIARAAQLSSTVDSIPLRDIVGVRRRRGGITLAIRGYDRTLYFPDVARSKLVERALNQQIAELSSPVWR
ncbi:MAG: hypothetical protein SOW59_00280 [Corynebacterium sp.]|nr:hypothetical protein [Corynebacterium sp.]